MVTGAGTGIGARTAVRLAEAGADVLVHYHGSRAGAETIAAACRALGRRAELAQADLAARPDAAAAVVQQAAERLGRVDILVNNAALTATRAPFLEHPLETFQQTLAANVTAAWVAAQAAARRMVEQGQGGRIVNVGSIHARQSAPGRTAYEASKGALHTLTASLAIELGQHGITVNCVAPGAVVVERNAGFMDAVGAWYAQRTPLGRLGRPEDIAAVVAFLASDAASFISGETIFVDGGASRRLGLLR